MTDFLGEFFGTAVLILLGDGVVAGVLLNRSKAQNAGWIAITTAWAFAVMAGVYTARAVGSPGYINPVGPVAQWLTGALEPGRVGNLVAGEFVGAFVGAVLVWLHYLPHWPVTTDPGLKLGVFCTSPAIRNPPANLLTEAIATFVLIFVGSAVVEKGLGSGSLTAPLGGALVWGIGLSLGGPTGYAINPARDLSPRLAHFLLPIPGKGPSDWGYAWIPVVGPLLGGVAGAFLAKEVLVR
jgi:glycerol uptake facilitator protein